ncbi:hypothetical protein Hanom_Chr17g01566581 [Helianthus anomalus]
MKFHSFTSYIHLHMYHTDCAPNLKSRVLLSFTFRLPPDSKPDSHGVLQLSNSSPKKLSSSWIGSRFPVLKLLFVSWRFAS